MVSEFDLIKRFFTRNHGTEDVVLGIGDDAALLKVPEGQQLVVTTDTLIENVHFPEEIPPEFVGYKALAVNLSDLAAMGAEPRWATLALSLPEADEVWLEGFSRGFLDLADEYDLSLVGGDTTRGPLSITVQAIGLVPAGLALLRSGAAPGDLVYVSGSIGDAGLALSALKGEAKLEPEDYQCLVMRLHKPTPRVLLGTELRGLASSCIDVSDGLIADLSHILEASTVGADITLQDIPFSKPVRQWAERHDDFSVPATWGDDFELVFTVPADSQQMLEQVARNLDIQLSKIGKITAETGLRLFTPAGEAVNVAQAGYDHFGRT
jgi:thiamine-monophosphate kinase